MSSKGRGPPRIEKQLAVGGTSSIELARDTRGRAQVIKRVSPEASARALEQLAHEGAVLARVSSPHVIRALGGEDRALYLEYVDGGSLADLLAHLTKRGTILPPSAVSWLILGVASALDAIHEAGFIHGDLSPANIMLGLDGSVKVIDLGLARAIDAAPPQQLEGTPAYLSPEQLRLERADVRADLYALGLIAYELVAGLPARPAGMVGALELMRARSRLPAAPSVVRSNTDPALDGVILALLEPVPERRPNDVRAWLAEWSKLAAPPERAPFVRALAHVRDARKPLDRRRSLLPASLLAVMLMLAAAVLWAQSSPTRRKLADDSREAVAALAPSYEDATLPTASSAVETTTPAPAPARKRRTTPKVQIAVEGSPPREHLLREEVTLFEVSDETSSVVLRFRVHRAARRVSIGAAADTYYDVLCGAEAQSSPTPRLDLPLDGTLECIAHKSNTAPLRFTLQFYK